MLQFCGAGEESRSPYFRSWLFKRKHWHQSSARYPSWTARGLANG